MSYDLDYSRKDNMCDVFVYEFIKYLKQNNYNANYEIYNLNNYLGDMSFFKNRKRIDIYHVVLKLGNKFLDLTPEQFGFKKNYKIYTINDLKKMFLNIKKIDLNELKRTCVFKLH